MPKHRSQQCYTKVMSSQLPENVEAIDELAKCIKDTGSAEAVLFDKSQNELRTLLVSDLVQSTAILHSLGDELGREYIKQHDGIIRTCIQAHHGVEVAHTGDGVITSFASPSRALHCARAIQEAVAVYNQTAQLAAMHIRIGVHAGRPLQQEGRLLGACVNAAVRICAKASGGQVLASRQVYDLILPYWFSMRPRGYVDLRGVPQPVEIFELDWTNQIATASN